MSELGVDVASFQGHPDWTRCRQLGYRFAIVKVSEGTGYANPTRDNIGRAVRAGLTAGGYHFATARHGDGAAEAAWFLRSYPAPGPRPWHLLPTLDLEEQGSEGVSDGVLVEFARAWRQTVCRELRIERPILYTDPNMLSRGLHALRGMFLLWLARPGAPFGSPQSSGGWDASIVQHDWHGSIPGAGSGVDRDYTLAPLSQLTIHSQQAVNTTGSGGPSRFDGTQVPHR